MRGLLAGIAVALASSSCSRESDLPPRYRGLEVPQARLASPEAKARGRRLFDATCAHCHGAKGDGHGPRSEGLNPPARNLRDHALRSRLTPRRLFATVREGRHGTAMPAMPFSDEETWDVVAYVMALGEGS